MKPDTIISLIILLITALSPLTAHGKPDKIFPAIKGTDKSQYKFILNNGRVYIEEASFRELPIEGNILGIYSGYASLYYIKETEAGWLAGRFTNPEEGISEFILGPEFLSFHKLICHDNIFYLLADIYPENVTDKSDVSVGGAAESEKVLVRFDPDKNEKKIIRGVHDFVLSGKGLIMLTASVLDCNGSVIPVTLQGERYIDRIINERFVFLSNGDEVEVIDVISQRNIYFYRDGKAFPFSQDYNIILEFNDSVESEARVSDSENMIYYQVNVNGTETGRTETAPSKVGSSSMIKAETGRYCIIKAERWELDRIKGRYVRVNNIYQPEEVKIYIPENRIIKVRFIFDGEKYLINQSVYDN